MSETQAIRVEDKKALESKPKPKQEKPDYSKKAIKLSELTHNQRILLRGGMKELCMNHPAYNALGNMHKRVFIDTCSMMSDNRVLPFLPVEGEDYWDTVDKQKKRFARFKFTFTIPGTTSKIELEKVWRYEDFTP